MNARAYLITGLLATSLTANAMLSLHLARRSADATPPPAGSAATTTSPTKMNTDETVPAWKEIDGLSPDEVAAQLRSDGVPEKLVFDLTSARVLAQFDARRREALAAQPVNYWTQRYFLEATGGAALRSLSREYRNTLRSALGAEAMTASLSPEALEQQQRSYGSIPPAKLAALQEITSDYADLRQAIQAESGLMMLAEDRAKIDLLATEEQNDLKALLSAEEYLEYQLRRSSAANQVRSQLQGVEVTEAEFRQLYQLQQGFLDQYGTRATAATAAERRTAEQQLNAEIKTLLGPDRGTEYELNRDFTYRQLKTLTTRLELPAAVATEVHSLQRDLQQRAARIRGTPNLTPEQRAAQLSALVGEASTAITGKLGTNGFTAYQQTSAGAWLRSLSVNPNSSGQVAPATSTIILR